MDDQSLKLFQHIRHLQIQSTHLADDVLAGAYHSAFKGKGIEFEEVREYLPGDEIRSIDWNVTARMGHPFVKLFKEERELTILLVVDASLSCRFGDKDIRKSDLISEIGALLAFSAIKNNDKVGLVLFTDRVEKYLPPAKGLRHILRIIREILTFSMSSATTDIAKALSFVGRVHQKPAVCFVISDFLAKDFSHEWNLLAKRHDLIAIRVSHPYEHEFPLAGLSLMADLETKKEAYIDTSHEKTRKALSQQFIEQRSKIKAIFNRAGSSLIDLSTKDSALIAIRQFFKNRSRRRR